MAGTPWKQYFWRNLTSSYFATAARLLTGVLLFPLLYRAMSQEQFGFWSLLWGVLSYSVLMDFGLGMTATVEVAKHRVSGEWDRLNKMLSSMFWAYVLVFAAVEIVLLCLTPLVLSVIHTSPEDRDSFRHAYIIFTMVVSLGFPLGLFSEVLRGLQRMDIVNSIWGVSQFANLAVMCAGVFDHWRFEYLILGSVLCTVAQSVGCYLAVRRLLPELRLSPRLMSFSHLRPVLSFSMVSYFLTLANLVIARTDQVVISCCLGVAMVAVYQVGFKVSDLYGFAFTQIGFHLSQAAAHSNSTRNHRELNELLVKSTQLSALLGIPGFVLAMVYVDPLIRLLTGLSPVPPVFRIIAYVLLISRFSSLLTHTCPCAVFLGAGWERQLLRLTAAEAIVNLAVSVLLALKMGVVGVALGTLVPAVIMGWCWLMPMTLRFTGKSWAQWFGEVYEPILQPVTMSLLVLLAMTWIWPVEAGMSWCKMGISGVLTLVPTGLYLQRHIRRGFWDTRSEAEVDEHAFVEQEFLVEATVIAIRPATPSLA
jgi:O-antigen/teichoic acid export membrane protein